MRDFLMPQGRPIWISGLRFYPGRVEWQCERVDLTYGEFRIVEALAQQPGIPLRSIRIAQIYRWDRQLIDARRALTPAQDNSVRKAITRIREAFRAVDPGFAEIDCVIPHAYVWRDRSVPEIAQEIAA